MARVAGGATAGHEACHDDRRCRGCVAMRVCTHYQRLFELPERPVGTVAALVGIVMLVAVLGLAGGWRFDRPLRHLGQDEDIILNLPGDWHFLPKLGPWLAGQWGHALVSQSCARSHAVLVPISVKSRFFFRHNMLRRSIMLRYCWRRATNEVSAKPVDLVRHPG